MTRPQSEQQLENALLKQLETLGHSPVSIPDEKTLLSNLKAQLEKHNKITFSDSEFKKVVNILNAGSVFERAKTLRGIKHHITKDDGETLYFEFLNQTEWCKNQFQVTNQVTIDGKYENRYDVTILINGLPLVQIELKKRGCEMAEAHRQIQRYKSHSFGSGSALFQYVQLFIISNGVNTKYFANNRTQALNYKQTFYWADEKNDKITNLSEFAQTFLEPCHLSKMICKYIVLAETDKILMVLRPYQYYATEKIIERVKNTNKNGYIWHTTGSGKTLTSFKASQILMHMPQVHKVVFVVDRRDLDYQTTKEFNNFSGGSVDGTDNTKALVKQFGDDTKLLVTTIQKLNNAIGNERYASVMESLKEKKIVFIFDECHRSQFGETHKRIVQYFNNYQMFGFTGTPIFADNAVKNDLGKRTTFELFGDCLHKYVITDAIRDENVLRFSIEYVGKYKQRNTSSVNFRDIEVEAIDKKELYDNEDRLGKITDYILDYHNIKTHNKQFTAMFAVSSVNTLTKYYDLFKSKEHKLKIATIFSYGANEGDDSADGITTFDYDNVEEPAEVYGKHTREKLEDYIKDYNKMFGTKFSTKDSQSYYNYYNDIAKRVKNREIDILIVVNMFLTGFDSKPLNTLYVDKNLKHHGLIQAFSRTNRILNKNKSLGNIVSFRNLKKATDEAIALFSNKDAKEIILMQPYGEYIEDFNEALQAVKEIAPTVDSVNNLASEIEELRFVRAFRQVMRAQNTLSCFADFSFEDLGISEQEYLDYRSKYLDLYEKANSSDKEKASALEDVDFELELMHRDIINVAYILNLLSMLIDAKGENYESKKKQISDMLSNDIHMRSKKELIEQFIEDNLVHIENSEDVADAFDAYWSEQQLKAFTKLCEDENLDSKKIEAIIEEHLFANQVPALRDKVMKSMLKKESLLVRKKTIPRVIDKIMDFINTFIEGVAA
jgi:type I restriction enzyme R subunit